MTSLSFAVLTGLIFAILYFINCFCKNDSLCVKLSKIVIVISSYIFVIWANWKYSVVLAGVCIIAWFFAKQKKYSSVGIVLCVISLAVFKYTNFAVSVAGQIINKEFQELEIILPLGISFYVFSAISYIVDVKRGLIQPRNLLDVAAYLSFYPKITSGPIQRSGDFFIQSDKRKQIGLKSFENGIQIFVFGLLKKIVLADRLGVFVNQVYDYPTAFSSLTVFAAIIAYSLQIYFDFSGYSDMAVGTARIIGFELPMNFNLPYMSHNVTEFWKRWHISLSSWLMDYVYIPMGGNRKGKARAYTNLILTMLIGGIWHGANITYILWGLINGVGLVVHKLWIKITKSNKKKNSVISSAISITVTFLFTSFSWIFFRADTVSDALVVIKRIFAFSDGINQPYLWLFAALITLAVCTAFAYVKSKRESGLPKKTNMSFVNGFYPIFDLGTMKGQILFLSACGLVICLAYTGSSPFIYANY